MSKPKIVVIGDAIHDIHVVGYSRPSPEAEGVQVLNPQFHTDQPGGAAAVACMCAALGSRVKLASWLDDKINLECLKQGVDTSLSISFTTMPTKTRYYCEDENEDEKMVMRLDEHDTIKMGDDWCSRASRLHQATRKADLVLVADYGKGTLTKDRLRVILDEAPGKVIVDPARGRSWTEYHGCLGIKANQAEWNEWQRELAKNPPKPYEWLIVTNGGEGATLSVVERNKVIVDEFPPVVRQFNVSDTIGAGDQFFACLGVMLAEGLDVSDACGWATLCAGLGVEKFGTTPVTRGELEDAADRLDAERTNEVPAEQVAQP